jgi:anti-sigma factor RsiW
MRCSKAGKNLSPYIDNELEAKEIALLETHLAQCDQCTGKLEEMRQLEDLFSQTQEFSAPPAFRLNVMERVNDLPSKGFSFYPVFTRFAEVGALMLAITAGIMSGGLLINAFAPQHRGGQVISSLSLETFEALPPDSLGRAYLAMTEERR